MGNEMEKRRKYEPPVSLHPLDPEDAIRALLQVDPEKVKERERSEKERHRKARKAKRLPKRG